MRVAVCSACKASATGNIGYKPTVVVCAECSRKSVRWATSCTGIESALNVTWTWTEDPSGEDLAPPLP